MPRTFRQFPGFSGAKIFYDIFDFTIGSENVRKATVNNAEKMSTVLLFGLLLFWRYG